MTHILLNSTTFRSSGTSEPAWLVSSASSALVTFNIERPLPWSTTNHFGSRVPVRNPRQQTFKMPLRCSVTRVSAVHLKPAVGAAEGASTRMTAAEDRP